MSPDSQPSAGDRGCASDSRHLRLDARDPGGAVGLRGCDPVQPVRRLRRATSVEPGCRTGSSGGVNATNPDANAWARLERGELDRSTASAPPSRPRPGRSGASVSRRQRSSSCSRATSAPRWSRRCAVQARRPTARLPHEQLRPTAERCGPSVDAEVMAPVRRRDRVEQGRRPQARAALLRAGLRAARRRAARVRVPRRPRRQPQAGPGHGHDDHQGRRPRLRP